MNIPHFVLSCPTLLAIMSNSMSTHEQVFVWMYVFISLVNIFRSGIAGLCTILRPHERYMRVSISLHSFEHLLFVFLIIAILLGVKWYVIMVLICISLTANDVEHFFFHVLICHLFILFGEMSIQILH